jgi:hypothetical protein
MRLSKNLHRRAALAIGAGAFALVSMLGAARAATVTYNFTGLFDSATSPLNTTFNAGTATPITGSFSYETTTTVDPTFPAGPGVGVYPGAVTALQINIGGWSFSASDGNVHVFANFDAVVIFADSFLSHGVTGPAFGGYAPSQIAFQLLDFQGTVFSNTLLPALLDVPQFDLSIFSIFFFNGRVGANVEGNITNLTLAVSEVPLPGALPLFASGLGVIGLLAWRRKRKKSLLAGASA